MMVQVGDVFGALVLSGYSSGGPLSSTCTGSSSWSGGGKGKGKGKGKGEKKGKSKSKSKSKSAGKVSSKGAKVHKAKSHKSAGSATAGCGFTAPYTGCDACAIATAPAGQTSSRHGTVRLRWSTAFVPRGLCRPPLRIPCFLPKHLGD